MSKRPGEETEEDTIKKLKIESQQPKDDNNVIDSELLTHQTNYQDDGQQQQQHHHHHHHQHLEPTVEEVNASKAIEDLNKLRAASDIGGPFDYGQLLKQQNGMQAQAQREAQAQAIQAQAQAAQAVNDAQVQQSQQQASQLNVASGRPQAGTDEWHKIRRDNHKEVERRRRENINAGIKALSSLLPTNETNKAQILQRAVEYIKRLKENETNNIEKWTLEKLLTDQAVAELSASNEKLKQELEKTYRELEHYKKIAKEEADKK
ncbi:Cbf1 protein [Saccharomycopsis crataegensis]|uniref:Cbf1 protein n=1 Tax=Saccharomycopsis crataegensis TaxID=43959 RepID=A0AAV5QQI4_9ASCO|nr:Cbf1 protein [Saccharomycopsis crataegensis]